MTAERSHVSEQRLDAAAALRALAHAFVAHDADDAVLSRLAEFARETVAELRAGARRDRASALRAEALFAIGDTGVLEVRPAGTGDPFSVMADRAVAGRANPTAAEIDVRYDGEEAVATVTFGAAFEGAPGRAHGGIVAAVFDDVTGYVLRVAGTPAFTGRIAITYHAPTPIGVPLEFRSRLAGREGRRLVITADCRRRRDLIASCEATYVTVDAQQFQRLVADVSRQ